MLVSYALCILHQLNFNLYMDHATVCGSKMSYQLLIRLLNYSVVILIWFAGPDYGTGIMGKGLEPMMWKGLTKHGRKIFLTYFSQSVSNFYAL